MDDDAEKMREKYGNWAQNMTESDAKSMLSDYGEVMEIMKGVLEEAFGEGHSYSIDDGEARLANDGGGLTISGDLDGVASFGATLYSTETSIMLTFYYQLSKLDCEVSEIEDAIQVLEDEDIFDYSDIEPSLEIDVHTDDEDETLITCNWHFHCEPMFNGAPSMDNIIEFDNQVNEIINSHKK